jgi:transposase-like protein
MIKCPHCTNERGIERVGVVFNSRRVSHDVYLCPVCSRTWRLVEEKRKPRSVGVIDATGWQDDEGAEY